ncbi:MAG TPA: DedA family protein [Solirubrobacteraceae bacterium]|nr:DedA family protein [Solirubrobacteraceae bacterium]
MAAALISASITEGIVNGISDFVREGGWPAIFVLMAASAACIPIPSEVVMLFGGFAVADPGRAGAHAQLTMAAAIAAGTLGALVGSWVAYAIGYGGRIELIERHGRLLHISPAQIARAEQWFGRFGKATVFFGRFVPFVRAFVSLPAGVARMGIISFSVLTALASAIWAAALAYAGNALGSEWQSVRRGFEYVDYVVVAAIVLALVYAVVRRRRSVRATRAAALDATE